MGERTAFLSAFLRDPFATGAIAPSSPTLAGAWWRGSI
jgi:phospholipid N-methyltransferase